jgi:hypothetical protein
VICPKCRTPSLDGAFICENCNAILDTTFLGDDITNEPEAAPVPEADATRVKPAEAVKPPPPKPAPASRRAANAAGAPAQGAELEAAAAQNARKKFSDFIDNTAPPPETAAALDDLVQSFRRFSAPERHAAFTAFAVLATLILPWQWRKLDGDTIGVLAGGGTAGLVALVVLLGLFVRSHPLVRPHRNIVLGALAALACFALLSVVSFWLGVHEEMPIKSGGRRTVDVLSRASFGLFAGLGACVALVLGTVRLYLARNQLEDG